MTASVADGWPFCSCGVLVTWHLPTCPVVRVPPAPSTRENDPRQRGEYLAASRAEAAMADWKPSDPSTKENDHA